MPPYLTFFHSKTETSIYHAAPLVTRNVAARDTALSRWDPSSLGFYQSIVDEEGSFNGTCTTDYPDKISVEVPPKGSCSSFYSDVTSYCCAAVGGVYSEIPALEAMSMGSSTTASPSSLSSNYNEPLCETSSYSDMLSCFSYTIERDCRHRPTVSPGGLCRPRQDVVDTSNERNSSHGNQPTSRKKLLSLGLLGLVGWQGSEFILRST